MLVYLKLVLRKMRTIILLKYAKNMESSIREEYSEEDFEFLKELSEKKNQVSIPKLFWKCSLLTTPSPALTSPNFRLNSH